MKNLILIYFSGADDDHLKEKPQSFLLTTPDMSALSEKEQTNFLEMAAHPYSGWTAGTCKAQWIDEIRPEPDKVHFALDRFIKYVCEEFGIEDTRDWWQYPHMEDAQDMFDSCLPFELLSERFIFKIDNNSSSGYFTHIIDTESDTKRASIILSREGDMIALNSDDFHLLTKVLAIYARACKKIG